MHVLDARVVQQGYARTGKTRLAHDRVRIIRQFVGSLSEHLSHTGGTFLRAVQPLRIFYRRPRVVRSWLQYSPSQRRKSSRLSPDVVIVNPRPECSKIELVKGGHRPMPAWRKYRFIATSYLSADAAESFCLPETEPDRRVADRGWTLLRSPETSPRVPDPKRVGMHRSSPISTGFDQIHTRET